MYGVPLVVMFFLRGCSFKMLICFLTRFLNLTLSKGEGFLTGTLMEMAFKFLDPITAPIPPLEAVRSPE